MTIYTVQFDYDGHGMYNRLLKVFKDSVKRVMPDVNFVEQRLKSPGKMVPKSHSLLSNTLKLREWRRWMDTANDNTVFMDCDMLLLHPIDVAFEEDFDVAYTTRTSAKMPMNGGVVFAKPTEGARKFFKAWLEVNEKMYKDRLFHEPYRIKYAGMNQAAFGYLLENPVEGAKLLQLPCAIWNSCSEDWRFIDGKTRVVHIKSFLRKICLQIEGHKINGYVPIVDIWRDIDKGKDPSERIKALSKNDKANAKRLAIQSKNVELIYIPGDSKIHRQKTQLDKRLKEYDLPEEEVGEILGKKPPSRSYQRIRNERTKIRNRGNKK